MIRVDHPADRVLVTIPISHYCEKARWALDRAGLAYDEQRHGQGICHQTLAAPKTFTPYNLPGVPAWERRTFPLARPALSAFLKRYLDVNDATAARARTLLDEEFDAVARRLADGRRYLTGARFTAADLAFAALAAPLVVPAQYGVPLPQSGGLPAGMESAVAAFRAHPAGAFALRLFREDRGRVGPVTPVTPATSTVA